MSVRKQSRDFSAVVAFGTFIDFIDEVVPANCKYIIKTFGNDLSNVLGWTFCHWQFIKNGIPQYPLNNIYDQMGYAAARQPVQNIVFEGGSRFQLRGINDTAATTMAMLVSVEWDEVDNQ